MDREIVQSYINNFRREITKYLKHGFGIKSTVFPYSKGVILRFELEMNGINKEEYKAESPYLIDAMRRADVDVPSALNSYHKVLFAGTNTVLRDRYIFLIKDLDPTTWTEEQAYTDVKNIINPELATHD